MEVVDSILKGSGEYNIQDNIMVGKHERIWV